MVGDSKGLAWKKKLELTFERLALRIKSFDENFADILNHSKYMIENIRKEKHKVQEYLIENWFQSLCALLDEILYIEKGTLSRSYHKTEDKKFTNSNTTSCSVDGIQLSVITANEDIKSANEQVRKYSTCH